MEKLILNVEGMSCGHCVKSITDALSVIKGVSTVEVSLENKTVTVEQDGTVSKDTLKTEIEDIGYDVV